MTTERNSKYSQQFTEHTNDGRVNGPFIETSNTASLSCITSVSSARSHRRNFESACLPLVAQDNSQIAICQKSKKLYKSRTNSAKLVWHRVSLTIANTVVASLPLFLQLVGFNPNRIRTYKITILRQACTRIE